MKTPNRDLPPVRLAIALLAACALGGCGPDAPAPVGPAPDVGGAAGLGGPRSDGLPGTEVRTDGSEKFRITDAERHYRPATYDDMIGRWYQVTVAAVSDLDVSPPWYSGEQMFEFTEDGKMKTFLVPPSDVGDPQAAFEAWKRSPGTIEFQILDEEGLVRVNEPGGREYLMVATYYTRDAQVPKKGDLTLTYLDKKTRASLFYRLLRRE